MSKLSTGASSYSIRETLEDSDWFQSKDGQDWSASGRNKVSFGETHWIGSRERLERNVYSAESRDPALAPVTSKEHGDR